MSNKEKKTHKPINKILLSIGAVVIFALAAFSFLILPALMPSANKSLPPMGYYKNEPIEYTANTYFTMQVQQYRKQLEQNKQTIDINTEFSILQQAFNASVMRLAITDDVNASGYMVVDSQINRAMLPYFSENGVYSPRLFNQTPQATIIEMQKNIAEDLVIQRYVDDIFGNTSAKLEYGLKMASAEVPFIAQMGQKERSFNIAAFPMTSFPTSEIVSFGSENADLFAQADLSILTFASEAEAKKILSQLQKGELLFADAISELSTKQYGLSDGKLASHHYYYQLKNLIADEDTLRTVLSLETEALSNVIKTGSSWSIFRADFPIQQANFEDQTTIDAVYTYMKTYEAGIIEDYFMNNAKDFVFAATREGFNAACVQFNVAKTETTAFPLNYNSSPLLGVVPSNVYPILNNTQANKQFLKTAFSLDSDEISNPLLVGSHILVLQLRAESDSDPVLSQTLEFMYPYYVSQFDQQTAETYFISSKAVKNNVLEVFYTYLLKQ